MTGSTTRRGYHSPLREAQAERTRGLILDALAGVVAEEGFAGVSVREVARHSGVAERTVYRHFPDREALEDALVDRLSDRYGWTRRTETSMSDLRSFPASIARAYAHFDAEEEGTRIAAMVLAASDRGTPSSMRRHETLRRMVDEGLPEVAETDRRVVAGILHVLSSSRTWRRLTDDFGITGQEAGPVLGWMASLVIDELRAHGGIPTPSEEQSPPDD